MIQQCNCCGKLYDIKHMVKKNIDGSVYYIPHAIRIFGLFKKPEDIRKKLEDSELIEYLYILPSDPAWEITENPDKYFMVGLLPYGWRKERSIYGNYYWLDNRK